jgi:predicted nuclease with TOPRIM domain
MANIMDLHDKAMAIYDKVPKQSQHFREELSVVLTNMVVEYNNLSDLLHITENEAVALSEEHEALKHEFAHLRIENEKLRQKLSSGLV